MSNGRTHPRATSLAPVQLDAQIPSTEVLQRLQIMQSCRFIWSASLASGCAVHLCHRNWCVSSLFSSVSAQPFNPCRCAAPRSRADLQLVTSKSFSPQRSRLFRAPQCAPDAHKNGLRDLVTRACARLDLFVWYMIRTCELYRSTVVCVFCTQAAACVFCVFREPSSVVRKPVLRSNPEPSGNPLHR